MTMKQLDQEVPEVNIIIIIIVIIIIIIIIITKYLYRIVISV